MKYEELEQLAEQGKLILTKTEGNIYTRQIPIYSKTKGMWGERLNLKTGEAKKKWLGDVESYKLVKYHKVKYFCRTKEMAENEFWKITKSDYLSLTPPPDPKSGKIKL